MTSDIKVKVHDLQKISVADDECLVIIVPVGYTGQQMRHMADTIRQRVPGIADRLMIVSDEVKFATIKMHESTEFETRSAEIPLNEMEKKVWQ